MTEKHATGLASNDLLAVAKQAAADLFTNGAGAKASRLLLVQETTGYARVENAAYLGGWSENAMADRILRTLKTAKVGVDRAERLQRQR